MYACIRALTIYVRIFVCMKCMHACTCTCVLYTFYTKTVQLRRGAACREKKRVLGIREAVVVFKDSRQVFGVFVSRCVRVRTWLGCSACRHRSSFGVRRSPER